MKAYDLRRYHLSLSSFGGIVPGASHWWCRIRWVDDAGADQERDAEHGRGDDRTSRFDTKTLARSAGLRLVRSIAEGYYVVTEGSHCVIDPQPVLSAPGNLQMRLNNLQRAFEKLNGWGCAKIDEPKVQAICDSWESLIGESYHVGRQR